jgi:hypothetical protein
LTASSPWHASVRDRDPRKRLAAIFRARGVRPTIRELLAMTPGVANADEPNYEYPWRADPTHTYEVPYGHAFFDDSQNQTEWTRIARYLADETAKIVEAVRRGV